MEKWFNLVKYTNTELILFGIGGALWVVVYVIMMRNIRKHKVVEIPWFIGIGDIVWEFIRGFIYPPDLGDFFVWGYRIWFLLDLYILWGLYMYGKKQADIPQVKSRFALILTAVLVCWSLALFYFIRQFDDSVGCRSAFILNVLISSLYITLLLRTSDIKGFSMLNAWCKMLGTFLIGIFTIIHFNESFMNSLIVMILAMDIIYIVLLGKRKPAWI